MGNKQYINDGLTDESNINHSLSTTDREKDLGIYLDNIQVATKYSVSESLQ